MTLLVLLNASPRDQPWTVPIALNTITNYCRLWTIVITRQASLHKARDGYFVVLAARIHSIDVTEGLRRQSCVLSPSALCNQPHTRPNRGYLHVVMLALGWRQAGIKMAGD